MSAYLSDIRGRVWKQGLTWHYAVSVGGRVVLVDNTGSFAPMVKACTFDVAVARRVISAGHGFQHSWSELVEAAA